MTDQSKLMALLSLPDYQPQPTASETSVSFVDDPDFKSVPPTQPNPLVNGNFQTVFTGSIVVSDVKSTLYGPNGQPLATINTAPNQTLGVALLDSNGLPLAFVPGPGGLSVPLVQVRVPTARQLAIGTLHCATNGAAPAPAALFTAPANGTRITGFVLSVSPTDTITAGGFAFAVARINAVVTLQIGSNQPTVFGGDGPIVAGGTNVTLNIDGRSAGAPGLDIFYNVYGVDL